MDTVKIPAFDPSLLDESVGFYDDVPIAATFTHATDGRKLHAVYEIEYTDRRGTAHIEAYGLMVFPDGSKRTDWMPKSSLEEYWVIEPPAAATIGGVRYQEFADD